MPKTTRKDELDIIEAYQTELVPMIELANRYNMTRQGIWHILKRNGVDTSKNGGIAVSCTTCGEEIKRHKSRLRRQKHIFCCQDCYTAFLNASGQYVANRHGQRVARSKVSEHFELSDGNVVHHIDKNNFNNTLRNLMVFKNQGDHIRHHRGLEVEPIWDGSALFR